VSQIEGSRTVEKFGARKRVYVKWKNV
jgi:hypothetical protein